jgi:peptidylprolyl isomerase
VGTEKRERQKVGKQARAEAEIIAARRSKTRRTALRVVIGVVVVLAALFAYSALSGDDDDSGTATDETTTTADSTTTTASYSNPELAEEVLGREPPDPEPPPEGTEAAALETETLIEGSGEGAAAGDTVTVHYIGKTPDGNVFDQSWERGETFPVTLGQGQVIPGWDQGLIGAKIGERRRLVIGSENAYGEQGSGDGTIPANSPLAFEVDVVDITQGAPAAGSGG